MPIRKLPIHARGKSRAARGVLLGAVLWFVASSTAEARGTEVEARVAEAVGVERAPRMDGTLNDPLWLTAKPIEDFRQREPHEGEAATEKTEIRILYTRHAVYFGSIVSMQRLRESLPRSFGVT